MADPVIKSNDSVLWLLSLIVLAMLLILAFAEAPPQPDYIHMGGRW